MLQRPTRSTPTDTLFPSPTLFRSPEYRAAREPAVKMTFGIVLYCDEPPDALLEKVRLVEDLGFRYLWLSDLALQDRDFFAYLTLAAVNTSREIGRAHV